MKKWYGLMLAALLASQAFAVSVDFYDEQQNNPSATGIRLRINNDSNSPISNAKLRYYFHKSSQPYAVDGYYLANAAMTVTDVNDDLAYFEIAVSSIPVGYYPDMAGFSLALHNSDWSSRDKTQDYSYQVSASLAENTKVVLLSGDDVLFGVGPNAQSVTAPGILKISGLKFSDNSWIEIKNVGGSAVALSDFQLVGADNSAWTLNGSLDVGEVFRVCQNQTACGSAAKSQVVSGFDWGSDGEALLKQSNDMVSYVAWGQPGAHADDAVNAGVWDDAQAFFPAETQVQTFNADYTKDAFFRLKSNKSGVNTDDWFSFTSNDNPTEEVSVPLPIKTSANKPVIQQIPGDNEVLFSWLPVQGVNSYRVIVRDQNNNDVYNLSTSNTSVSLALTQGLYSWTVLGGDEYDEGKCYKKVNGICLDYQIYEHLGIQTANIDTSFFKQLQIHEIAARRDTRMLNLGYLNYSYKYSWDKPNLDAPEYELHESFRCWAVAIQVINHFYGGNLTQDEIVYHTKYNPNERLLSPFYRNASGIEVDVTTGELAGGVAEGLKWALHTNSLNYAVGTPSYATVKNAIDNDKLIYVNMPNHAMVIYGYVGDANNYAFYYAFGDNDGHVSNSLFIETPIESYMIPNVTYGNVEMSKVTVHMDSDGDGITDFEESNRFNTDSLLVDTDNDGIEDKREIYDYTAVPLGNSMETHISSNPYGRYVKNYDGRVFENPIYKDYDVIYNRADRNKNSVFAELDPDDDGDGIEDGLKGGDVVVDMDVPGDYTIFGREYVRINDRVKCYNTSMASDSYCDVASSDENKFSYDISYAPINIGVRAHVGSVDIRSVDFFEYDGGYTYPGSHSNPTFRSSSVVHGNLNIYAVPYDVMRVVKWNEDYGYETTTAIEMYLSSLNVSDYISTQDGATVEGNINLDYARNWNKEFTYTYSTPMPSIPTSQTKVVQDGQTYRLKDGDAFSTLRVEAGGTLIIEPGEMFVDKKLQIESNSTVRFAEPGKGTVLHTNGEIIWRTYNGEPATNNQYWATVARGFKLAHHSSQGFYIGGLWAGTIYAPKAKVVMGQVNKTIYGRILARDVIVHQNSNVYRVDFDPTDASQVAYAF